jgi:hypothetical protein
LAALCAALLAACEQGQNYVGPAGQSGASGQSAGSTGTGGTSAGAAGAGGSVAANGGVGGSAGADAGRDAAGGGDAAVDSSDSPSQAPPSTDGGDGKADGTSDGGTDGTADGGTDVRTAAAVDGSCDTVACTGLARGEKCSNSVQCSTGNCVEGVCCENKCSSKCTSCVQANTTEPDGTCAAVKAHTVHGNDCTAAPKSTCGTTGECDGAGGCLDWPADTVCQAATCDTNGFLTKAMTCNGAGGCVPNGWDQCSYYQCDTAASKCKTSCATAADCRQPYHCLADHTCGTAPVGTVCSVNEECTSGSCGGRCCADGTTCMCPQPSSDNLLVNPGFDKDVTTGWTSTIPPMTMHTVTWSAMDATSCSFSGSAQLFFDTVTSVYDPPEITQCVPVSAGKDYQFGFRIQSTCATGWCTLNFFTADNCTGTDVTEGSAMPESGGTPFSDWVGSGPVTAPATAGSALLTCTTAPPIGTSTCATWFDDVYFSASPHTY